ncbi:MAG: hypothetical protein KDD51_16205, partial [Bdellovibrionales bacterium]|nr:hypothetical protein [Bdellovibrionales bacterium]
LNEFLPEGSYNKSFRSIMALKAEKEKWRRAVEGVGTAVHIFLTISLVSLFVGRNPMGARFTSTAVGRAVHVGVEIIIGLYFAWELYDQFNEDYWGGQGRVDFLMGNRDTQIEGYLPLMKDEQGFLVDVAQDDLLARQQSAMRWAWRIWMGLIVFQQLSYAQRVLRGGTRWVLQRVAPQTYARFQLYSRAKELGLDAKVLTAMPPQEAAERIRVAFLEKVEAALGKNAQRFEEVFELSPGAAATIRRDVKAQLRALCEELQLNPTSLAPLPLYGTPTKVQRVLKAREEAQSVIDELWAIDQQLARTRLLDKEDVLFLFAGRDSFYLPGLGHPVYRVMPRGLMFTGMPPALYAMGPGSRTLGRLYRAAQGKTDISNLVTFNYLASWREKAHGELVRIAEYFRSDISRIRADRASEVATQRTEYGRQLRNGEINAQEHERLTEALKLKEAQHSDVEEVLLAMIDTQHPLHSHFRFAGRSEQLKGTVENSSSQVASAVRVDFGTSAGRPDHISEQLARYAAEFRSICQNGAISPTDVDLISAVARRDYYWLGKEFSRPSRVAADSTVGADEDLRNPGASSQGSGSRSSTPQTQAGNPEPSSTEWVNLLKNTPKGGVASGNVTKKASDIRAALIDGEAEGLDFEKCWSYAVRNESPASRDYILSLARTRGSSETLGYSYGEKLRSGDFVGETGLMQQRAYKIAIAYTRDMEIAIETAQALRAKNAQAYFNAFYRVRLQHLERVLGEAPSMATSKGMFGMDPTKTKWTLEELSVGRESAVERGIDSAIAGRGERVLFQCNNTPFLVEDYSRLTEIPAEYFEMKGVLDSLLAARGARFAGRAVEFKYIARLRTLFSGRSLETLGEAENVLAVSRTAAPQEIRAAATRLRNEFTPRANRSDRRVLEELKQEVPEGEQMYVDALKRVDEAEQLLLKPPSAPSAAGPGPTPGSGPRPPTAAPTTPSPTSGPASGSVPTTPRVEKPSGPSMTTASATVDPKTASNMPLLDHPVVTKYISTPQSPSLFERTAGEEVAKLGEHGARLRVITRQAEFAGENAGYLSSEE